MGKRKKKKPEKRYSKNDLMRVYMTAWNNCLDKLKKFGWITPTIHVMNQFYQLDMPEFVKFLGWEDTFEMDNESISDILELGE